MAGRVLLLRNGRVLTPARRIDAGAVLVRDGRIAALGDEKDVLREAGAARADDIDLRGRVVAPAFIDAHIHLMASAARLVSIDCGPRAVASITDIRERVRERAESSPPGVWVRAAGYDEVALAERRHPNRRDLDIAAPSNPVRLTHRGGHAAVLNSAALALAGIDGSTPEPPGGHMERDLGTGEPTGLLIEMNDIVDRAIPPLAEQDLEAAVCEVSDRLLAAGITFVQDATATNGAGEWQLVQDLQEKGVLKQSVSMMEGFDHLGEMPKGGGRLRRGPVKVMPRELEHEYFPPARELAAMLRRIVAAGRTAAVHTVTRGGLDVLLEAIVSLPDGGRGHRIEHCGLCSAEQARQIARLGLNVVTQPGFLLENGDLIRRRLPKRDLPDLYPLRRLLECGVPVAGSSDAPVVDADVVSGLRGAVERRSVSGASMGRGQAISPAAALSLFTASAGRVLGLEQERGSIATGLVADLVVLSDDPTEDAPNWDAMSVEMTLLGGEVVYERKEKALMGAERHAARASPRP